MPQSAVRIRVLVHGTVQGVGFRPFVRQLAVRHALVGFVGNDERGVFIEAEGAPPRIDAFLAEVSSERPPLAVIDRIEQQWVPAAGGTSFEIVASTSGGTRDIAVAVDSAPCAACLRELFDPEDRRYRYPFINCTNCGPRFTIVRDVPYDRPRTTMRAFAMCAACAREYGDPDDRRFHAQPVCCPRCGPQCTFVDSSGHEISADPIRAAGAALRAGAIVAVKGLGGYHLAARAADEVAVATLRNRKHRAEKPFALMVPDVDAAQGLCEVTPEAGALLADHRRPIVLLERRRGANVATAVAPRTTSLGLMLPYTPLHVLLLAEVAEPLVMTSGNRADEPIAFDDADARERLGAIADCFLVHDRPIHTRTDDSVARVVEGEPQFVRRSRGYVPAPIALPVPASRDILACGAELKNTFCLASGRHAFVSHHIGDLENYATFRSFVEGIEHFERLFAVRPEIVAYDLHPEYLSTKYALERDGVTPFGVQHHHAHIASCLADNGESGPVIGIAFDGLGFGCDRTLWGGEILVADLTSCRRAGHLASIPLPGGAAAIREPWRMAATYLDRAAPDSRVARALAARHGRQRDVVVAMARQRMHAPETTSMGRLFDAIAAIVGVRDVIAYEGQAAIELEQLADRSELGSYPARISDGDPFTLEAIELVAAVAADVDAGTPPSTVSARFHNTIAALVVDAVRRVRTTDDLDRVALSGGVFQNVLLHARVSRALRDHGFRVLTHRQVPPNDGGISLGQAAVAAAVTAKS